MFSEDLVSSSRIGDFVLVEDLETNDFTVKINRKDCSSSVCLGSLSIEDRVGNHILVLYPNGQVSNQ